MENVYSLCGFNESSAKSELRGSKSEIILSLGEEVVLRGYLEARWNTIYVRHQVFCCIVSATTAVDKTLCVDSQSLLYSIKHRRRRHSSKYFKFNKKQNKQLAFG